MATVTVRKIGQGTQYYDFKIGDNDLETVKCYLDYTETEKEVTLTGGVLEWAFTELTFEPSVTFESGEIICNYSDGTNNVNSIDYYANVGSTSYMNIQVSKLVSIEVNVIFHDMPEPKEEPTFNHTYLLTNEELEKLVIEGLGVDTVNGIIDLRDFMLNLINIPFEIPETVKDKQEQIVLGQFTRETTGTRLTTDLIKIDLGKITIPEKYSNAYDYYNTECTLYLPFTDKINILPEYVINQTIGIEYNIEIYKGTVNINVYSDKTENIIYSATTSIGRQIPFISYWKVLGDTSIYTSVFNDLYNAYIEIKRKIPKQDNKTLDVKTYDVISNFTGYVEIEDIDLNNTPISENEQTEIEMLLEKGVYING